MTRRELATKSGVSERFLADVERGTANPSVLRVEAIARALDTSVAALLAPPMLELSGRARVIAFVGLRGAGKSSLGARLAARLGRRFVEVDAEVERRFGLSLAEIFELHGAEVYRLAEREVLDELLQSDDALVLATGGGIVTESDTWAFLKSHATTIWLRAEPRDHWDRVVAQGDTRPMAGDDRAFANLCAILETREPRYREADWCIETSGRDLDELRDAIVERLGA